VLTFGQEYAEHGIMTGYTKYGVAALAAAGIASAAVIALIHLARKAGLTSKPDANRWGKKATPLLGGTALFAGFAISYFIFGEPDSKVIYVFATCGLLYLLGLLDDIYSLRPNVKIIGQIAGACLLIYGGVYVNIWFPTIGIPLSILWFVGISNAVNLLDNMDGVAAGVCAICAGVLVFHAASSPEHSQTALAAAALCGACVGFLIFNFHPAKIYMGDSGSLFLGMALAALGVTATYREATNILVTLLVPVMVLGVPLFDMVFVSILRKGHGRSISTGGKDHTAHHLIMLGLSERKAAVLFYVICLVLGAASILARAGTVVMILIAGLTGAALLLVAFLLGKVKVYSHEPDANSAALAAKLFGRYRRAAGLAIFDVFALTAAYVAAYFIRFDWQIPDYLEQHIPIVLPAIIMIKLLFFLSFRVYSIQWEKVKRRDIWGLFKAVTAGSILSVAATHIESGFKLFLVSVLIIDWLLCLVLLSGARMFLPLLAGRKESN